MRLSKPQKLIYDMENFVGSSISIICGSMLIPGEKTATEIKSIVNKMYQQNDFLRVMISENNNFQQIVMPYKEQEIEVLYFENKSDLDVYAEKYSKIPLDMNTCLCEMKAIVLRDYFGVLIKLHHLISDAWSLMLLAKQFKLFADGNEFKVYSYSDYIESETQYLSSKRYQKDKEFFISQFVQCQESTFLSEHKAVSFQAQRKKFFLNTDITQKIKSYAVQNEVSEFLIFLLALSIYFSKVKMNKEQFYIGTAVLNRTSEKEKSTVGNFINTIPLLINIDSEKTFYENLLLLQEQVFSSFRHQKYNYGDFLREIRSKYNFKEKVYDTLISYQNAALQNNEKQIVTTWYHNGMQTENLQIHIDDRDTNGQFCIDYDYLTDVFTNKDIDFLHKHICNILSKCISDDTKKISEVSMLSEKEKEIILFDFNKTACEYDKNICIHQAFERAVQDYGQKIAIIAKDRNLTYYELNIISNRIAHHLVKLGVEQGDKVAFSLARESIIFPVIMGILKSGAAYVPIDIEYPEERKNFILQDCKAKLFICKDNIKEFIDEEENSNLNLDIDSNSLCYCLYTSGSTGKPKGVMINHKNIMNYINQNECNIFINDMVENCNTVISVTTVCFDVFVTESIGALIYGKKIIFADEEQSRFKEKLEELVLAHDVDMIETTPSKMKIFCSGNDTEYLNKIKIIALVGESTDILLLEHLKQIMPNARIYDMYGPTETTVYATGAELSKSKYVHIGKPLANTQVYIVDKCMQLVPIGITGELCIAGDGVGNGYLNRPELTAEKFVNNPFGNGKLYKTGDLAYWDEDGNIVYVGRNDFQVKIRGLRIELGEIENAISNIDGVNQCIVVIREDRNRQFICAFYTGDNLPDKDIRTAISKTLPKYMLPHIYKHLEKMPINNNGKVDRKFLPQVDLNINEDEREYTSPRNQREKMLCTLIEKVSGIGKVGINDNFTSIGIDSLMIIEFISGAREMGLHIPLQNTFDYPTVAKLSKSLDENTYNLPEIQTKDLYFLNETIKNNCVISQNIPDKKEMGNILIAGATGYLGIHILSDYIDNDRGTAYCLVRGKNTFESQKRLFELLKFYFGDKYDFSERIKVLCADISEKDFGLDENNYNLLIKNVKTVINSAASVKHYGSYEYFHKSNVKTTENMINFCLQANAKYIHISTLSVSGNSFADDFNKNFSADTINFKENDFYVNQPLDNVYARSKFIAEKLVLNAVQNGLQANIMRMGNLTNRYSDGKFQKNYSSNAFLKRMKAILEIGIIPDYLLGVYAEFTPVDEAARAVMSIVRNFNMENTIFHINNDKIVYLDDLVKLIQYVGIKINIADSETFINTMQEKHTLSAFINDLDENNKLNYESKIHIDNKFTVAYLKKLGFEWSQIDVEYVRRYIDYFKKIGYLEGI